MIDISRSGSRSLVLGRIRDILGDRPSSTDADYESIARDYQQSPTLEATARVDLLVERLEHYQVGVYRCEQATVPRTIAQTLANRHRFRVVVAPELPRDWLPSTVQAIEDAGLEFADLDRMDGVVTGCSIAIAATGTIVLCHERHEGRRALTLVPDYHLCVISQEQVVQTVPEAIRWLADHGPRLVTTISGPSATADIEMTRIRGVHGPRTLDVIVIV